MNLDLQLNNYCYLHWADSYPLGIQWRHFGRLYQQIAQVVLDCMMWLQRRFEKFQRYTQFEHLRLQYLRKNRDSLGHMMFALLVLERYQGHRKYKGLAHQY
ncbi:MAG: hypothetical protein L3J24_03195 [Xanthomonadales bacterium]|nr:hypothetical protein [Xanthomonadales bacterium]